MWQARRLVMHMCRCQVQVGIAFPRPFGLTVAWHRGVDHGMAARELERGFDLLRASPNRCCSPVVAHRHMSCCEV